MKKLECEVVTTPNDVLDFVNKEQADLVTITKSGHGFYIFYWVNKSN